MMRWLTSLPRALLIHLVKAYRFLFSPWIGQRCRFIPSCSHYALQALSQYGAGGGTVLTTWRILRCHPFCRGGFDPVPDNPPWRLHRKAHVDATPGLFTGLTRHDGEFEPAAAANDDSTSFKIPS